MKKEKHPDEVTLYVSKEARDTAKKEKDSGLILVKDMERVSCHDCGCKVGENHEGGCDVERCPKCGGQLLSCGCFSVSDGFDEDAYQKVGPEKWSGIMFEEAKLYCEKHDLYTYFQNGWVKCDKNHPKATHDLNKAVMEMMKKKRN